MACSARASSAPPATRIRSRSSSGPTARSTWRPGTTTAAARSCRPAQPGRLMRIDFIGDQVDTTAPVVEPVVSGAQNSSGAYLGRATLTLNATDSSGVSRVEYSLDGTEWTRYTEPVGFTARGDYTVRFRATDRANNTSEIGQTTFTVVAGAACLPTRSDEFNGARQHGAVELPPLDDAGDGREGPERLRAAASCCRSARSRSTSRGRARSGSSASRSRPGTSRSSPKLSAPGLNADVDGPGQHVRPGGPEDLPERQQLDQGRAQPQRGQQPDGRGEHVLRALAGDQRHAHARHPHRPRRDEPADVVGADRAHRRDGDAPRTRSATLRARARTGSGSARRT